MITERFLGKNMSVGGRGVQSRKIRVDEVRSMDILDLQRKKVFSRGSGVTWTSSWSRNGEVVASNFDEPPEDQTRVAEVGLERAKRLVEMGKDVVVLLDSITRLARAYNLCIPTSGRTLSGGFDPAALYPPKRFFGAARKLEGGGSLTIMGTALIDTGSKMDELIYEEFMGTGNMEVHLDRRMAERRIYPAIDIQRSGTRQEELLYDKKIYPQIMVMRRMIDMLDKEERTSRFLEQLKKTKSNAEFIKTLKTQMENS